MRKLKLYIATSLNGYIAQTDGSVEWLNQFPPPTQGDYGYGELQAGTDTTVQGYSTYQQLLEWEIPFPYTQGKNYVLTRQKDRQNTEDVEFVSDDPVSFMKNLKKENGKDIWLIGGGQINTLFLNAGLIDEIQLFIMPIVLSAGIQLFEGDPLEQKLHLSGCQHHETGVVELLYTQIEQEQVQVQEHVQE